MNRDLKEKGLRLYLGNLTSSRTSYEPRPEREGIKTYVPAEMSSWSSMNRDLKEKGLRHRGRHSSAVGSPMNRDLKEKGLRRSLGRVLRRSGPMNRDLKEKGLRPCCQVLVLHTLIAMNRDLKEKGLRPQR